MTKEEAAYAATLNLLGSDVLDPRPEGPDAELVATLAEARRRAAHSTGPHVDCPYCFWTVRCDGTDEDQGEHFADLWEHLIARHGADPRFADDTARKAWSRAVAEHEGAKAA
ncbi:hypothetical protein ABTY20_18955 [Streptomyces sp. NPDC126497]|uniref:hypothetical protein n=1 Tax=Streptomyces sp. NPDC126497 TaxID=3155313 RepID=UPI00333396DA